MINTAYDDFLGDAFNHETNTFNGDEAEREANLKKNKFNIILLGATGVGKSALVNAFFGEDIVKSGVGTPVTQHLEKIKLPKKGVTLWDTKGIESQDYEKTISQLKKDIDANFTSSTPIDDALHLGWLCLDAQSGRIEPRDLSLIKIMKEKDIPLVVVFTKVYGDSELAFIEKAKQKINEEHEKYIGLNYAKVNSVNYKITSTISIEKAGLDELFELSINCLPNGYEKAKNALKKAQIIKMGERLEAMKDSARNIVHLAAAAAGTVGASPIPGSDAPLIAAVQSAMIYKINSEFELDSSASNTTSVVTGIMGVTAIAQLGKTIVSNALKFIPGIGSIAGGIIASTTAIALTEAVGHAYIQVLNEYYNKETGQVELPKNTIAILDTFKEYFSFKK